VGRSRVKVDDQFTVAIKAAHHATHNAVQSGVDAGRDAAQGIVQERAASRGYDLVVKMASSVDGYYGRYFPESAVSETWGDDPWYLKYFEYGTHHINAMPFMRPASRAMKQAFERGMDELERGIRERVR